MTLRTISQFKSNLSGGGARPNLFEVELNFPTANNLNFMSTAATPAAETATLTTTGVSDKVPFLVKAAALPASNITPISVPFRGRELKVAGERTFDSWTVTVLNDTDFKIRTVMEQWMNAISRLTNASGETNPTDYTADALVKQLGRNANILRQYNFIGLFPTNVSEIALSMDTTDTIEEFTVEFQVLYWTASAITSGAGDSTTTIAPAIN
jgi:hypothetical protein